MVGCRVLSHSRRGGGIGAVTHTGVDRNVLPRPRRIGLEYDVHQVTIGIAHVYGQDRVQGNVNGSIFGDWVGHGWRIVLRPGRKPVSFLNHLPAATHVCCSDTPEVRSIVPGHARGCGRDRSVAV